ncbi:MAG: hypothetical protein ACLSVD_07965 [Eggerthellaceae bacterium]
MTHLPAPIGTRRSFCTLSAVALASLALPARRAFGDEGNAATATQPGAIVRHTNDVLRRGRQPGIREARQLRKPCARPTALTT